MFRPANPSSRFPVYLQAYTKENAIWQLKLAGVYLVGLIAYETVQEIRERKRLTKND